MKILKIIAAAGLAVGYSVGCYIQRGYWNPISDAFMLSFMAVVYLVLKGTLKARQTDQCKVKSFEEYYDDLFNSAKKSA